MKYCVLFSLLFYLICNPSLLFAEALKKTRQARGLSNIPMGKMISKLIPIGYSGNEYFHYDVSWTGSVKVGEVTITVGKITDPEKIQGRENPYKIEVSVSTAGSMIDVFYSIRDRHITRIDGTDKLPYHVEMWQKEGRKYRAYREYIFDQQRYRVTYTRNQDRPKYYQLNGIANNEFSAFLNSRLMDFTVDQPFLVPTFADKKRILVKVTPVKKENIKTMFGKIDTYVIMPLMTFKGLYEKQGDTEIWYSDDECRVPVKVNSKLVIGSLTAKLTRYKNSACKRYNTINGLGKIKSK